MPRPDSPLDLIKGHPDFPFEGWKAQFGQYHYFRVRGYDALMVELESRAGALGDRHETVKLVKSYMGPARDSMKGTKWENVLNDPDWDKLGEKHISFCRSTGCRFDKALLAIACLEYALKAQKITVDIYKHIQILPAVYVVDGFDKGLANTLAQNTILLEKIVVDMGYNQIKADTLDPTQRFLALLTGDLVDRYPVTLATAALLVGHLAHNRMGSDLKIRRLNSRTDNHLQVKVVQKKRPAQYELLPLDWEPVRAAIPTEVMDRIPYLKAI